LKTLRQLNDGSSWMPEILGSYGESLVLAGRGDEARSSFEEALNRAHELKDDGLIAQTLDFQGDAFLYAGDAKAARSLYEQSLQEANRNKDDQKILLAKIGLAEVEISDKNGRQAIPELRKLIQQADDLSLKYSSVECSIFMGEAMMQNHDYAHARQELQHALLLADNFGQQPLSVQAHYLLATIARDSGNNADAQDHYRSVISTLDTMKKEPGAEKLLQRTDLKLMYDESSHWSQAGKS
ncbi:MAG: tetratricopeptide repeat protein, partial [Candidatus Sulfotelmatobacter sp.]